MVDLAVEGLTDNKIQDGRRLKGKSAELCYMYYPHCIDYFGAKCYVFGIKEFLKTIIGCEKTK
jgi:hypothetical protein